MTEDKIKINVNNLNVAYGQHNILSNVNMQIPANKITALIGASGSGKSTFIRCLNRMNDFIDNCIVSGQILMDNKNLYEYDPVFVRSVVGMVFQKPNPFDKSIYDNVAYGVRLHSLHNSNADLDAIVESSLKKVGLWKEVKDHLRKSGKSLSGGQQQRLCIARAIAISPQVILMDEPCSSLDPIATAKIESLIDELNEKFTIVIVTHSMHQASRISNMTAVFHAGTLVEIGKTEQIFTNPKNQYTKEYITGRLQ